MTKDCKTCNTSFSKKPSESMGYWETRSFCSVKCVQKDPDVRRRISESQKGRKFSAQHVEKLRKSQLGKKQSKETIEKRRQKMLGRTVSAQTRQKISDGNWRGGKHKSRGYVLVAPKGKWKQSKFEHRAVMETVVGRQLKKGEIVHHWNEITADNRPENLALLRSISAHRRLHNFARRHGVAVEKLFFGQPWLKA